jgi:hypothetical protein
MGGDRARGNHKTMPASRSPVLFPLGRIPGICSGLDQICGSVLARDLGGCGVATNAPQAHRSLLWGSLLTGYPRVLAGSVIPRPVEDLNFNRRVLQGRSQFYRAFPICATWHKLTWAHHRLLINPPAPTASTQAQRGTAPTQRQGPDIDAENLGSILRTFAASPLICSGVS